ncbi:MAG: hypothetical protein JOZ69_25695 [Myxococcales bacterium]|nr:hypothetical protein [Myxococcales bacterium]
MARRVARVLGRGALVFAAAGTSGCTVVNSFPGLVPQKDRGAIVIGGTVADDGADQFVLTALDPLTGQELKNARRPMTVAGVQYSGRGDLWYVFESGVFSHFFPLPTDGYYLHAMQLDPASGTWTELGALSIPPALSFSTIAVLNDRIAYVAYANGSGDQFQLVVLDTTTPSAIREAERVDLPAAPVAVIGVRGSGASGTQRVLLCSTGAPPRSADAGADALPGAPPAEGGAGPAADDDGGGADADAPADAAAGAREGGAAPAGGPPPSAATLTEYFVAEGTASAQGQIVVPSIGPLVGFASITPSGSAAPLALVVARPIVSPSARATVSLYDPVNLSMAAGTFSFNDFNVQPPAFSPCDAYAFVVGTDVETNIHAVDIAPLLNGAGGGAADLTSTSQATGNSGQGLYFEPYTRTVLAPFSQGASFTLTAFGVERTADGKPQLKQRGSWQPPSDLRPSFVATKTPVPFPSALCSAVAP